MVLEMHNKLKWQVSEVPPAALVEVIKDNNRNLMEEEEVEESTDLSHKDRDKTNNSKIWIDLVNSADKGNSLNKTNNKIFLEINSLNNSNNNSLTKTLAKEVVWVVASNSSNHKANLLEEVEELVVEEEANKDNNSSRDHLARINNFRAKIQIKWWWQMIIWVWWTVDLINSNNKSDKFINNHYSVNNTNNNSNPSKIYSNQILDSNNKNNSSRKVLQLLIIKGFNRIKQAKLIRS